MIRGRIVGIIDNEGLELINNVEFLNNIISKTPNEKVIVMKSTPPQLSHIERLQLMVLNQMTSGLIVKGVGVK